MSAIPTIATVIAPTLDAITTAAVQALAAKAAKASPALGDWVTTYGPAAARLVRTLGTAELSTLYANPATIMPAVLSQMSTEELANQIGANVERFRAMAQASAEAQALVTDMALALLRIGLSAAMISAGI